MRAPAASEFEVRLPVGEIGMFDGLAQRFLLGLLQRGGRLLVEARRIFAVGAEHAGEERRRHFVMLGVGLVGMFGDGTGRHLVDKPGIAFGIAGGEFCGGARAEPVDRGANDDIRQRHPFGGADDRGYEAHVTTPFILSMIFSENRPPLCANAALRVGIMLAAAAERRGWYATDSPGSDRRPSAASVAPAAGCR